MAIDFQTESHLWSISNDSWLTVEETIVDTSMHFDENAVLCKKKPTGSLWNIVAYLLKAA